MIAIEIAGELRRLIVVMGSIVGLRLLLSGFGSGSQTSRHISQPPVPPTKEARQCLADLRQTGIRFTPLPDRYFGGGCSALNSVKLDDIGTPVTNLGAMTCPLASRFSAWARYGAQPARSEEHTTELQSLMRNSYAVFRLQKKKHKIT